MLLFLETPCLVVAVQPCMEWIPTEKIPPSPAMWDSNVVFTLFIQSYNLQATHLTPIRQFNGNTRWKGYTCQKWEPSGHKPSIQIIIWNSLHKNYAEHSKALSLLLAKTLYKNCTPFFCILQCNFGYKQNFLW